MSAPERTSDAAACQPLTRGERQAAGGWLRVGRAWAHRSLSRVAGRPRTVAWMLAAAMSPAAAGRGDVAFALPVPYATEAFGERLCLELPTQLLERRLADWVRYGSRIYYVGEHFLGLRSWDGIAFPFARTGVMREAAELARLDFDYRASRSYAYYRDRIAEGRPVRRNKVVLASEALLDAYFERFVELFRSIESHGVLPLDRARAVAGSLASASDVRRYRTEAGERDIGVAIGPAGEIYGLPGGKHRAAIASVLGIPRVPVEVRMVHAEWVRAMCSRHGGGAYEAVCAGVREIAKSMIGVDEPQVGG